MSPSLTSQEAHSREALHREGLVERPTRQAVALVSLAILNFALKYLTSMALANTLGITAFERYAVAVASVVFCSTMVELGLGKQGLRLMPTLIEKGRHSLAAGYWRFTVRTVFVLAALTAGVLTLMHDAFFEGTSSDEAIFLLPIVATVGVAAEIVLACGAAVAATVIVRVVVPLVPLAFVAWAALTMPAQLTPRSAILAYGAGWLVGLLFLLVSFVKACPRAVLRGPPSYESRPWLRGGIGFLGVAIAISALIDGSVVMSEFARVPAEDISIYAVCIETGGFVLILVKSLDKFYLQQISALIARGSLREIQRIRRRRATLMTSLCVLMCLGVIVAGKPLLRTFGEEFVRGHFALCCITIATSAWTLTSLSQWLIAFIDGPVAALRISITGVFAVFSGILILGPSQGLVGVALAYSVMVLLMSLMLASRARLTLSRLVKLAKKKKRKQKKRERELVAMERELAAKRGQELAKKGREDSDPGAD